MPPPDAETRAEILATLRLIRSENVGPATYAGLLQRFGSAGAALEALPGLAKAGGRARAIQVCPDTQAEDELAALTEAGARLVTLGDPDYPRALAAVEAPPPLLTVKGDPALLAKPAVAIVGARNASALGRQMAETLARDLGHAGILVVSGLARGVDTAAHRGALETGTAAVVAGGLDVVYPPENAELQDRIGADGVLLSEMPWGMRPQGRHFPRRNRIVSGMALAAIVVEAAQKSGSLITARLAAEQGREVFAVPGSPLDPRAHGPNGLIREGATLIRSAADVLEGLAPLQRSGFAEPGAPPGPDPDPKQPDAAELDAARRSVLDLLSPVPVAIDTLVRQSGHGAAAVHTVLLELDLAGRLDRQPGHRVALRPRDG